MNFKKAFTLIELLVVIAVIGILSGLIIVSMSGTADKATIAKAQVFNNSLRNSLMLDIVSEWRFDENTGASVADSWNGGNTGTLVGTPTWRTSSNCIQGSCIEFDGIDDLINISFVPGVTTTGNYTMTAWFKKTNTNNGTIINISNSGSNRNGIMFSSSQIIVCGYYNGSTYTSVNYSDLSLNVWHHVVCTNKAGVLSLYIDGRNVNSGTTGSSLSSTQNCIGYNTNAGVYFTGLMDEIRIYNATVPTSQIEKEYFTGLNNLLINGGIDKEEYLNRIDDYAKN